MAPTESTPPAQESSKVVVQYEERYQPWFLPLTLLLMPIFWEYQVRVTDTEVSFGYTGCQKSAALSFVVSAEPFEIKPLAHWGGYGIRVRGIFQKPFETAYVVQSGPGVRLVLRKNQGDQEKQSIYVFSCQDPERVCQILNGETEDTAAA